ncbi:uncharacterized protein VP01_1851g5 [Puccinia sorghi]|uniref:Uncharacterized protein n=1 Tax=Puccinia sorghi TaxID=27349 RepID=A0A0L6VE69_9BASI|nr:uncharacterized protein VP01_1851g5 [Puccinia sorghi]
MAEPYRNQKGILSQNILSMVDLFTYVMARWEGNDFIIPQGCFYLSDTRYSLAKGGLCLIEGAITCVSRVWQCRGYLKNKCNLVFALALIHNFSFWNKWDEFFDSNDPKASC